jgi:lysozyme
MLPQQLVELQQDEGLRLFVYDDATGQPIVPGSRVVGHPTIGYGRALDVAGITEGEAATLLANKLISLQVYLEKLPWYIALDDVRRGVILNLSYNMGVSGVEQFTRMIAALQMSDWDTAASELTHSKWVTQVQRSRSLRLINQLKTGQLGTTMV